MESFTGLITPIVTALSAWFFARRKNNAEAKKSELDNVEKAISIWRKLSEDMDLRFKAEIEELRKENCNLQNQITQVMKENESLKSQMNILETENKKLISQLKIFNQKSIFNLTKE